jgi:tetratricopeptide (TPR) repeat protein
MTAVDVSLSTASAQQSQEAPGSPETEELRAQLQQKAQSFYQGLLKQTPDNEEARRNMAMAHLRLGDIDRLSEKFQDAVSEYNQAINQFEKLSQAHPTNLDYPQNLGYCHNWLGETYRAWRKLNQEPAQETAADVQKEYEQAVTIQEAFLQAEAQNEYDLAIAIQQDLHQNQPAIPDYQQDLARSFYNRGNLLNESQVDPRPDYQQAINLLKPIAGAGHSTPEQTTVSPEPPPEQELARVDTDLGIYLDEKELYTQAVESHEQAIQIVNALRQNEPANYEYKMEAANYYFNLACVLGDEHQFEQAKTASDTARHLFNELAAPSQALEDLRTKNDRLIDWIDKNNHGSAKSAPGK